MPCSHSSKPKISKAQNIMMGAAAACVENEPFPNLGCWEMSGRACDCKRGGSGCADIAALTCHFHQPASPRRCNGNFLELPCDVARII
mmetsp:Transcript_47814/g.89496  ORF Transcript_47814/g.89496 Transcript_47814/m.89496 type:complete len:88 (-) Transcript_47814:105-368(-)